MATGGKHYLISINFNKLMYLRFLEAKEAFHPSPCAPIGQSSLFLGLSWVGNAIFPVPNLATVPI